MFSCRKWRVEHRRRFALRRPEFMDVVNVLDKLLIVMAAARISLSCSLRNGLGWSSRGTR